MSKDLPINQIIQGDCLEVMKGWPDGSVQCCVTSPPYWGLRDYGVDGQLGLEKTPEEYVAKMVEVFREVKRVLRDDGTLWLNLGDSYSGSWGDSGHRPDRTGKPGQQREKNTKWFKRDGHAGSLKARVPGLKPKDLCGIPWRVAFALQADGWYLRQDIIWNKPNPMPESCTDRCTKAHEYLFLLTKNPRYFYDQQAIAEPASIGTPNRQFGATKQNGTLRHDIGNTWTDNGTKNKRSVWTITTKSFPDAHFATFPPKLVEPCILAGTSQKGCCPECGGPWERVVEKTNMVIERSKRTHPMGHTRSSGKMVEPPTSKTTGWRPTCPYPRCMPQEPVPCVVFDPFMGSGTVAMVAAQHDRNYVGIELNEEYAQMARERAHNGETGIPVKEARKGQMAMFG
jgi:DNA modification methylase